MPEAIPVRTCAGCRRRRAKGELTRFVLGTAGTVILDALARAPGRGVYLCRDSGPECIRAARKRRSLSRSLRVGENVIDYETLSLRLTELAREETP